MVWCLPVSSGSGARAAAFVDRQMRGEKRRADWVGRGRQGAAQSRARSSIGWPTARARPSKQRPRYAPQVWKQTAGATGGMAWRDERPTRAEERCRACAPVPVPVPVPVAVNPGGTKQRLGDTISLQGYFGRDLFGKRSKQSACLVRRARTRLDRCCQGPPLTRGCRACGLAGHFVFHPVQLCVHIRPWTYPTSMHRCSSTRAACSTITACKYMLQCLVKTRDLEYSRKPPPPSRALTPESLLLNV